MWAFQGARYRSFEDRPLISVTGLYRQWAEELAAEAGKDPALALRDMAASRDDFLSTTGGNLSPALKADALLEAYPGDMKACRAAAQAADFDVVFVGG